MNHNKHGTLTGYNHYKCRCDHCKAAMAEYRRKSLERDPKKREKRDALVRAFLKKHPEYNAAIIKKHREKYISQNRCIWCGKFFGTEVFRTNSKSKYCDECRIKRREFDKKYAKYLKSRDD